MALIKFQKDGVVIFPDLKIIEKYKKAKTNANKKMALSKEMNQLTEQWKEIMAQTGTYNKSYHTYTLSHISKENYGYKCRIYAPKGMALEGLEKIKLVIESGLKCIFLYEISDDKDFAMADIIKPGLVKCNDMEFAPVKVKPYQLYAGVDVRGKPIIFNVNITPHVLLAGQTRKGKNGSLSHMLISLIHSCNEYQVEIYLFQCAKSDLIMYESCKQVRCCILGNLQEMKNVLEYIISEIKRRSELLTPMIKALKGDNIFDYNKLNPKKQLPYIYCVVDEIMVLMLESATKEEKDLKERILSYLQQIAEFGGAMGVTYITCHQKPESKLMPTFLKNMSLVRICFGFDDESCSRIVLGEKNGDLALKLPARRAYYSADGKIDLLFTTNLKDRIEEFIKPSMKPGHYTILDLIKSKTKQMDEPAQIYQPPLSGKIPKQDFSKVEKTKDEILKENISKIPNFVPYEPIKGGKIKK